MEKSSSRYTFKKFINDVHLWLGIGSGLILFIVCLTGTMLAFQTEITGLFLPNRFKVQVPDHPPLTIEEVIQKVESATDGKVTQMIILKPKTLPQIFTVVSNESADHDDHHEEEEEHAHGPRGKTIYVNPYTAEVLPSLQESPINVFFTQVMYLHRWLMLGTTWGRTIVGIATIIFIVLTITGFILWLPQNLRRWTAWKSGFKLKYTGNWKRLNYDIHNTLGFYALILLLIMGFSGLIWSFPWYWKGMENLLGDTLGKQRFDGPIALEYAGDKSQVLPIRTLIEKADTVLPYPAFGHRINFPAHENETILVRKKPGGFFAVDAADNIQFNPYTGDVVSVKEFSSYPINEKIAILIRSIHVGSVFGLFSKILYFFACLIATTLPITGTIIWINKLKTKQPATRG